MREGGVMLWAGPLISELLSCTTCGIYCGWAQVAGGEVHKMVTSIGWNPFYRNQKKTVEPHLIHEFNRDFYGEQLKVLICGFVRPERDFESVQALIEAIEEDVAKAERALDSAEYAPFKEDEFFRQDNEIEAESKTDETTGSKPPRCTQTFE
eukprot:TRINITY_DN376_c0_g1_i6.p1 TRINITY_DN376_c0_g1~~TRINITY_DN376_c0_g1_i6.p1  ORF type:complete len:152 (-),score=37.06 TRINITY_DN376_c0_g1_i6:244-699(-)